jgi:YD repeat-containing protein
MTKLDGLGRVVEKQLTSDPSGVDYTDTTYNNLGQVTSVTQPYRSGASVYSTQYFYDALGRTTQQVTPNNGNKYLSYAGRATQIQQFPSYSNQTTIYQANGLGQIVSACEVTSQTQAGSIQHSNCGLDIAGSGFLTSYSYNALGNLTGVSNATNTRAFAYDGLLRLTQAVEPELYMNAVNYSYDTQSPGDLYQRTAPAPNQSGSATVATTYTHDAMHRLTQVNYSDGTTPSVTLAYDQASNWGEPLPYPKGRLTGRFTCSPGTSCGNTSSVSAGLTGDVFAFDPMGRVLADYQCMPSSCGNGHFDGTYSYNFLGQITGSTNVQGSVVFTNTYNSAAELTQIYSSYLSPTQAGDVVSGIAYNAAGQPTFDLLSNGITEAWGYDAANNQSSYTAGAYSNSTLWVGNQLAISATDSVNGNWNYGYDNFGRLSSSSCSSSTTNCPGKQASVGFNYVYDQLGNRWQQNLTAGSGPAPQHSFGAYNHISDGSAAYDSAGNLTNDSFHTYTFDAEGRMIKVDNGTTAFFAYDAAGFRVEQGVGSTDSVEYVYDLSGNAVATVQPGTNILEYTELFDNGRHWVTFNGDAQFLHADWVGTVRAVTNLSGVTNQQCTGLPFGDDLSCTSSITNTWASVALSWTATTISITFCTASTQAMRVAG